MTQIETIRIKRGFLKPVQLAAACGITERTITDMESGKYDRKARRKVQAAIAAALKVKPSRLFNENGRVL